VRRAGKRKTLYVIARNAINQLTIAAMSAKPMNGGCLPGGATPAATDKNNGSGRGRSRSTWRMREHRRAGANLTKYYQHVPY
jgi:hypothetical protein